MARIKYIKQLTRENTLLDRSLRMVAYAQSLREIGRARIAKSPIVGYGRVTSLYYDPQDYQKQQRIIMREYCGVGVKRMSSAVVKYLEQGYLWAKQYHGKKLSKTGVREYLKFFISHHAHARGTVAYGYWGEPAVNKKLRRLLKRKVSTRKLDEIISTLSVPQHVSGLLSSLHKPSKFLVAKRRKMIKKLKLNQREQELAEVLAWFTFFYEVGERVAMYLYDELISHLAMSFGKQVSKELEWYDVEALDRYLSGYKLSQSEIRRRQQCYVLFLVNNKPRVLSGLAARHYIKTNFEEFVSTKTTKVHGTVASPGLVRGRVKIVVTQANQAKVKQGDILVSPMTTPRLMTAVKRAAAIVTDEGGMTAHAAIVSRELGIPCIVGTKFATKVFKDGDKVEVDAIKGVVKKL